MVYCAMQLPSGIGVLPQSPLLHPMSYADSELRGLQALDPLAIAELHDRYYPEVYRYARYRLGDDDIAQDIASDVFVRLLEAAHAGRGPNQSLRGWLLGTASHLVMDHFRRLYSGRETPLGDDLPENGADLSHAIEDVDRHRAVRKALSRLTGEQQHVLALRFLGAYSLEETADLMGRNSNAVKALQFRALAALRRHLGEETP